MLEKNGVTRQQLSDAFSILTIDERRTLTISHLNQSEIEDTRGEIDEARWHLGRAMLIVATMNSE